MENKKEMTARISSVGAEEGQSFNIPISSISNIQSKSNSQFLQTISMTELYDTVYESSPPLINGLLYSGVYLFAGAPKLGKSFFMAQIAYHISTGTALWDYPVRQGTVLYIALEDSYRRLQERLYRMFGTEGTDNLFFSVSAGQLGGGLDEQLSAFMKEYPSTCLIIIDTLQKIREVGGNHYSYANDYEIITHLKQFADKQGICILLVHHTRKQQADDKFEMISGTSGLLGAADGAFVLHKEKRTSNAATLEVSGRDQQDQKIYLSRNPDTLKWELEKIETELWKEPPEPLLEGINQRLTTDCPKWEGTATELIAWLEIEIPPNSIVRKLNVLSGRLLNEYGIFYKRERSHEGRRIKLYRGLRDGM